MGFAFTLGLFFLMALYAILVYAGQLFLGLAVYNDAKARNIDMATLWGVLTGFFGFIPAIIYLVLRSGNKNSIKCPRCSSQIFNGMPVCPVCQLPVNAVPSLNPAEIMKRRKRAKGFLIAAIVFIVISFLCAFGFVLLPLLSSFGYHRYY